LPSTSGPPRVALRVSLPAGKSDPRHLSIEAPMRHRLCPVPLVVALSFSSAAHTAGASPASTESNFSCKYPNEIFYGPDTLRVIWKPLATLPALVRPGDTLTVWANAPGTSTTWSATLGFGTLRVPLAPTSGAFQPSLGWWVLGFQVPPAIPEELYSLT